MNRPLIVAAHRPESSAGRASLARLVNAVRREAHEMQVHDAFLDEEDPGIASVVAGTVGPRTVVPMNLFQDAVLGAALVAATATDPLVSVTPTLGPDWILAEIGVQRLIEAGARSGDTIVLATDAVVDRCAVAQIGTAARLLSAVWGGRVHVGILGGSDTLLGDALDIARAYQHSATRAFQDRVVVSSYLLTAGRAQDALLAAGADLVSAPLLNGDAPDPRLVSLVVSRARSRATSPDFAGP